MRGVVVLLVLPLLAGCIGVRGDAPVLPPVVTVLAVAEDFLGCPEQPGLWGVPASLHPCHEARLRVAVPAGSGDAPTAKGWSAVTDRGGVYDGRVVTGPRAVVAGGEATLRIAFLVDDGGRLQEVRWEGPANLTVVAPVAGYADLRALAAPSTLRSAERSQFDCDLGMSWPCLVVTLDVDNTGRADAFPAEGLRWVARGSGGGMGSGDIEVAVAAQVAPGAQGAVRLILPPYYPALQVGFRIDDWNVPAFDVPAGHELPLADHGDRMEGLDVFPLEDPYVGEDGLLYLVAAAAPHTGVGACTPLRGTISTVLDWQPGELALDALWERRATGEGPVTPEDFRPDEPYCAIKLMSGMQAEGLRGTYRLQVTVTPEATGRAFTEETFFYA